jgi:hypothetical protein
VKKLFLIVFLGLIALSSIVLPKKVFAQGYTGCLWIYSPFLGNYVCVRDIDRFHCDYGYTDPCSDFTDDGEAACAFSTHECRLNTTPTPLPGYYRCSWIYSPIDDSWSCVLDNDHCTYGTSNCDQFTEQVACELATHMCVVPPTSPPYSGNGIDWSRLYGAIGPKYSSSTTVGNIISDLLIVIFPIVGLVFLLILIVSGFKMMTSGGDPKNIASAKSGLTAGIVGFIIIFTAYWIVTIIAGILGLPDIQGIF